MGSVENPHPTPPPAADEVPRVRLVDRYIDEPRPLRVAVIGGGLSGITAGILLPEKVPGIQLTIYEKNTELSGTWLTNTYPGVRCDIPSHAYQSTFSPKPDWGDAFSYGPEIRDYWQSVARKHDVYKYVQLNTRVEAAVWDEATGTWAVTVQNATDLTKPPTTSDFDIVVTAVGRFDNWALPDYPGLADYKGHLRHAQNWDPSFDPTGKRVAVIGNGASGIQLVTNLQRIAGHLDHYVRNRTWIASSFAASGGDPEVESGGDTNHERKAFAQPYSEEDKTARLADPEAYLQFRKSIEAKYWHRFATIFKDAPANVTIREQFTKTMIERVQKKPELLNDLIPEFSPNCRRLTPGPGYLEALTEDNVDYIRTPIVRFTETGIETADGKHREVDAIICATGADTTQTVLAPPFPVRGTDGKILTEVYRARGHPYTYLGTATPGFPNLFYILGPNSSGPSGTVPYSVETQTTHIAKILRKISLEGVKSMAPAASAADEFEEWATAFFAQTVFSEPCRSWYNAGNPGGFISGMWPGSTAHLTAIRREPRWEDYEYTYLTDNNSGKGAPKNRFAWYFGNGWTKKEKDPNTDLVGYLHVPGTVSLKDLHEGQYSLP
ncbi:hypothetical protein SEUCBS139899_008830 [Sporothrix eucalyptigena]|uniref:Flavin-binding monooxygenase n=1 Tax=Sporothrix eucalyptigena TaxID=1812306 RepID=A0ABP0CEU2_9PEZI